MSYNEKNYRLPDIFLSKDVFSNKPSGLLTYRESKSPNFALSSGDISLNGEASKTVHSLEGFTPFKSISMHAFLATLKRKVVPPSPKPERSQLVFDALCKAMRECKTSTQTILSTSKVAYDNVSVSSTLSQGRLYEIDKQMKGSERYLKEVDFRLSEIEELKDNYEASWRLRDGFRAIGFAHMKSDGESKEQCLQRARYGFRLASKNMYAIERKVQSLMGTLHLEMIGIQGFARICVGDVFEIAIRHGPRNIRSEKWKTKGRVTKTGEQFWENKTASFTCFFNEPLWIKASEIRGLGKNITLGNKFCDIIDLFSAQTQKMTVNLNTSGSLKLNLLISWNPTKSRPEGLLTCSSPNSSLQYLSRNCISQTSIQEIASCSNSLFNEDVEQPLNDLADVYLSKNPLLSRNFNLNKPWLSSVEENITNLSHGRNLNNVISEVLGVLEENFQSYTVLEEFLLLVEQLDEHQKAKSSPSSTYSASVEAALGYFNFLHLDSENNKPPVCNASVGGKVPECRCNPLHREGYTLGTCFKSSSEDSQWDFPDKNAVHVVLIEHLLYSKKLINSLSTCRPFKTVENDILKKIREQHEYIFMLYHFIKLLYVNLDDVFEEIEDSMRNLWSTIAEHEIFSSVEYLSYEIEQKLHSIGVLDDHMVSIITPRMISEMLDSTNFNESSIVSVFHFKSFFSRCVDPDIRLENFVAETLAAEDLKIKTKARTLHAVCVLCTHTPTSYSLFHFGSLLNSTNSELQSIACSFLTRLKNNPDVISSFLEILKYGNVSSKIMACEALKIFQSTDYTEELYHVIQFDESSDVKDAARSVLSSMNIFFG